MERPPPHTPLMAIDLHTSNIQPPHPRTHLGDAEVVVLPLLLYPPLRLRLDTRQLRLLPQLRLVLQRLALDRLLLRQVLLLLPQLLLLPILLRVQLVNIPLPLQLVPVLGAPLLVLRLRVQRPPRLLPLLLGDV